MFEDFRHASLQLAQNGIWGSPPAVSKVKFSKDEPLEISIIALFPIPKYASKKTKELILNGYVFPTKKHDGDNIIKATLDALNGAAYRDDSQICRVYFDSQCCAAGGRKSSIDE